MPDNGLSLDFAALPTAPHDARHGVVDGLALTGQLASSTALLISEAVTNSVLHAGLDVDGVVHVDAWWTGLVLRVEICDEGRGMSSPSPAGPREGGHGLNLISHLASRWGVHSNGHTRVWFELAH